MFGKLLPGAALALSVASLSACSGSGSSVPEAPGAQFTNATPSNGSGATLSQSAPRSALAGQIHANARGAAYDDAVLNDKALAYFKLSDTGNQLIDSVTGQSAGSYGSNTKHDGVALTSDGGSSSVFPGGYADPADEAIAMPATELQVPKAVSVEAWFIEPALQPNQYIGLAGYGSNAKGYPPYGLHIDGNTLEFDVHPQNGGMNVYSPLVQPGMAHHAVGTYDGKTVALYLDGQLVQAAHTQGQFTYPNKGFSMGGSIGSQAPAFNGSVQDVSVYAYALSPTQVQNHYLLGAATPMGAETPRTAQSFIDSIGVNTHFEAPPYSQHTAATIALLQQSGIRHIREGMVGSAIAPVNQLAQLGVKSIFVTTLDDSDQMIESWPSNVPNAFEGYEGPNEPDLLGGQWAKNTRAFMQRLYSDVKGTPALSGYPVGAPALTSHQQELGDLSGYIDYGNMHDYFALYNPGTPGWGNYGPYGFYGSLAYNMNVAAIVSGSKSIVSTETGYDSEPNGGQNALDYATDAKYVTRTYFLHYNAGVARTYDYEFLDQDNSHKPFTSDGFVDLDLQPKPSYKDMQAIISQLSDAGTFAPTPLTYQLTGDLANVCHTLLEKSDGTYYIALWIEVPSWDVNHGHPIQVQPQTIGIKTQNVMHAASVMVLDDSGNATTSTLSGMPGTSVSLPVTDRISIVKLTP